MGWGDMFYKHENLFGGYVQLNVTDGSYIFIPITDVQLVSFGVEMD